MATRGSYGHNSMVKFPGASQKIYFCAVFSKFWWFQTKWSTGLLELIKLYFKQNPLEEILIFTIYQNYTMALIAACHNWLSQLDVQDTDKSCHIIKRHWLPKGRTRKPERFVRYLLVFQFIANTCTWDTNKSSSFTTSSGQVRTRAFITSSSLVVHVRMIQLFIIVAYQGLIWNTQIKLSSFNGIDCQRAGLEKQRGQYRMHSFPFIANMEDTIKRSTCTTSIAQSTDKGIYITSSSLLKMKVWCSFS